MASRLRRKGVSPVLATLILIVIAVVAGLVVYAWVMGWIGGVVKGGRENLVIRDFYIVDKDYSSGKIIYYITVENAGDVRARIVKVRVEWGGGRYWEDIGVDVSIDPGSMSRFEIRSGNFWEVDRDITVKVYTEAGGEFSNALSVKPWHGTKLIVLRIDFIEEVDGNYKYYVDIANIGSRDLTVDKIRIIYPETGYDATDDDPEDQDAILIRGGAVWWDVDVVVPSEVDGKAAPGDGATGVEIIVYADGYVYDTDETMTVY